MKSHDQLKGVVKTVIFIISLAPLTVSTGDYGHPLIYAGVLVVLLGYRVLAWWFGRSARRGDY